MDATSIRRWIARFEAIAEADREEMRRRGPDPGRSIRLGLALIEAARAAAHLDAAAERVREAEDERVRASWAVLRRRLHS